MGKTTSIYVLKHPISDEIRYVGKTKTDVRDRYAHHKYNWKIIKGKMSHVNTWIKHLSKDNLYPIMEVVDEVPTSEWQFWEIYWIAQFKAWGCNLCNHSKGGEGNLGYKPTEESKQKRLKTLETSEAWKESNKRFSEIMKERHQNGIYTYKSPSKEQTIKQIISLQKWYESEEGLKYKEKISHKIKSVNLLTGEEIVHPSIKEAGRCLKLDSHAVRDKLVRNNKFKSSTVNNYDFFYLDDNHPPFKKVGEGQYPIKLKSLNKLTNEEIIFESMSKAAKYFNVTVKTIVNKLEKKFDIKGNRAKLKDYEFKYV